MTHEIAWAAGLFEGEGSVYLLTKGDKHYARLSLAMTDRDVVERFAAVVSAGSICRAESRPRGDRPMHKWNCTKASDVLMVIRLFWPYLGERRRRSALNAAAIAAATPVPPGERTHCSRGHKMAGENVTRDKNGWRRCRQCNRDRAKARYTAA